MILNKFCHYCKKTVQCNYCFKYGENIGTYLYINNLEYLKKQKQKKEQKQKQK